MSHACAELLTDLIRFDTINPTGDEPALCKHLAGLLEELGADQVELGTVPRPGSPGAWVFARFGTPELLINAHVDTVPANTGWARDPHVPEITSDRVYGLGSCDTKGAIACALTAARARKPEGVALLFSGDEEHTSTVLPSFLDSNLARPLERAIVCEPTTRRAGTRHRGVLGFTASVSAQGGHSSNADHLPKPITIMARLAVALDELGIRALNSGPEDMKGLCLNVASLDGGVAFNVVPESAVLTWSLRHPPGSDTGALIADMRRVAAEVDPAIEVEVVLDQDPFEIRDREAMAALLGDHPVEYGPLQFWTEAAVFSAAGIDAVVVGPGDITQAHAADEFVTLADLDWATEMFVDVFERHARAR